MLQQAGGRTDEVKVRSTANWKHNLEPPNTTAGAAVNRSGWHSDTRASPPPDTPQALPALCEGHRPLSSLTQGFRER